MAGSSGRCQVLEHTLRVLGEHLAEVAGHRIGPEEVVIERRVRVVSLCRIKDQEFVEKIAGERILHVRLKPLLYLEPKNNCDGCLKKKLRNIGR